VTYLQAKTSIAALAGLAVDAGDYIGFFANRHGELMVFQQAPGQDHAVFAHSDLAWEQRDVMSQMLRPGGTGETLVERAPGIGEIVLNAEEFAWLTACFQASEHLRSQPDKA
jgi:hypothetical protein